MQDFCTLQLGYIGFTALMGAESAAGMKWQLRLLLQLLPPATPARFWACTAGPVLAGGLQLQPETFTGSPPAGCFMQYSQLHTVLRAADAS